MLEIVIYSIIIGAIGGGCIAAGAARMHHAPEVQAMGAFRTLGEMNACGGDPISHFSFGLGFLFSSAASAVAAGALSQDVMHRIVPNWAAGTLLLKNKDPEQTVWNPAKMMIAGAGGRRGSRYCSEHGRLSHSDQSFRYRFRCFGSGNDLAHQSRHARDFLACRS